MYVFIGSWRDVKLAAAIGLTTEAVIWALDFEAGQRLGYIYLRGFNSHRCPAA